MSRAFVREDGGDRWERPVLFDYQIRQKGEPEALFRSDDLMELLHWLEGQERGRYELRDQEGRLLAQS